jgi:hypothetical protein
MIVQAGFLFPDYGELAVGQTFTIDTGGGEFMKLRKRDGAIGGGRALLVRWLPVIIAVWAIVRALPCDGAIGG